LIKRGPVGLIGDTKGDANETVANLLEHWPTFAEPANPSEGAIIEYLQGKQIPYTTWQGWYRLDAHERSLGEPGGRERIKVVEREDTLEASEP
jgi:ferredoxin/flavodoxin---NADP+ reductase